MSALTAVGTAIKEGINMFRGDYWNAQNIAFQQEQNALNRQLTWDMWNAENRYNNPAAQMARLRAAGLNPGLMYSDGSAGMPSAQFNSPEQTAPQARFLPNTDPNSLANSRLADAQAELASAQAKSVESKIDPEVNLLNKQIDSLDASIRESYSRIDLNSAQQELSTVLGKEASERVTHWMYENEKTLRTLEDFVRSFSASADKEVEAANMAKIRSGQYERELSAYRYSLNSAANAALAAADKDSQFARDIEAKLRLFNDTYTTQIAIIRETKNDIVAGKQMKSAIGNQANASSSKIRKETGYVGWRNITGGISEIVSSGADVYQAFAPRSSSVPYAAPASYSDTYRMQ